MQVFRALEKWARVRPQDRQRHCATCLAQQAYEAAEAAKAAAGGGGGDAASAAAVAGRQQLEEGGGSKCSSCSTSGGYTSLESVLEVPPPRRDKVGWVGAGCGVQLLQRCSMSCLACVAHHVQACPLLTAARPIPLSPSRNPLATHPNIH